MISKYTSVRTPALATSNVIGQRQKRSGDKFLIAVDYQRVLQNDDFISSCTVDVVKLSDESDATSDLSEQFQSGNLIQGTATGGSTTTLIDTSKNFSALGVVKGDVIINVDKGQRMIIKDVYKTTAVGDTVSFGSQSIATVSGDAWKALFCARYIKGGVDGEQYLYTFTSQSNSGQIFVDSILIYVKDQVTSPV